MIGLENQAAAGVDTKTLAEDGAISPPAGRMQYHQSGTFNSPIIDNHVASIQNRIRRDSQERVRRASAEAQDEVRIDVQTDAQTGTQTDPQSDTQTDTQTHARLQGTAD